MRNQSLALPIRVTRTKRCPEGFYFIINGARLHFKTRKLAMANALGWVKLQRVQIISVRDYARRLKKGGAK